MAQELIIAHHAQLWRFTHFPVRIGQALDNDVIIKGAGVADHHAIIDEREGALTLRAQARCYFNQKALTTTKQCGQNDQLQIGLETLYLNPVIEKGREVSLFWVIFSHPIAVLGWFLLAIALPVWEGYLNSPQTYIPNYEIPLVVTFWVLALSFILQSMVFPLAKRYLILPILGIISAFISIGTLANWGADWYGFRFNGHAGEIAAEIGGFLFFVLVWRAFLQTFVPLCGRALLKVLFITLVPVLLFNVYSYLKQNDFFKKRAGSYPSYQVTLQNDVPNYNKIKSINDFFMIDKSE